MMKFSSTLKFAVLSSRSAAGRLHPQTGSGQHGSAARAAAAAPTAAPVTSSIIPGSAQDFKVNVGDTVHFGLNQYNIEDSDKARSASRPPGLPVIRPSA